MSDSTRTVVIADDQRVGYLTVKNGIGESGRTKRMRLIEDSIIYVVNFIYTDCDADNDVRSVAFDREEDAVREMQRIRANLIAIHLVRVEEFVYSGLPAEVTALLKEHEEADSTDEEDMVNRLTAVIDGKPWAVQFFNRYIDYAHIQLCKVVIGDKMKFPMHVPDDIITEEESLETD